MNKKSHCTLKNVIMCGNLLNSATMNYSIRKCSYHTSKTEVFLRLAVSSSARGIFLLFTMSMRSLTCAAAV